MTSIQSSQDFVRALKSATDPPFPGGPSKVEIAKQVWNNVSFYVPSKAEVITDWVLTKLLKDKGKDWESNSVLDIRYWTLLQDVIYTHSRTEDAGSPRSFKTWLGATLVRVPVAHIVLSFLDSRGQHRTHQDDLSKAISTCLAVLWPIGAQKTTTEALLECFCAVLSAIHDADEGLAKVASLTVNSYRSSLANNSNKKKFCSLFLQHHLPHWLECVARMPTNSTYGQLQDSIYSAGVETLFNLEVLRQSHDSRSGGFILNALKSAAESSRDTVISMLPRLFSSFLQVIKKYRTTLFGQGSNQPVGATTNEFNVSGIRFFVTCQALLDDRQSSTEAWSVRNALLDILRENHLFNRSVPEAELSVNQINDLAIQALSAQNQPSIILLATDCLSMMARIDYDIVLPALPRILQKLLQVGPDLPTPQPPSKNNDGDCFTSPFLAFLDLILDYYTKTRTIHNYISNLLDIVLSPKFIAPVAYRDPHEIYQSRSGGVLFEPVCLDRLAKRVQNFVMPMQTLLLAKTVVEKLETAWAGLEMAGRQGEKSDETSGEVIHPDILAVRLSLLATLASVVLSSLPARSLPSEERTSLIDVVDPLRASFVAKVVNKLSKKLRRHSSHEVWRWQICAVAALRMGYVLDMSRNLGLPQPTECNAKLSKKLEELAGNEDVLPELSLEVFRHLLSKADIRDPVETQAVIERALVYLERRLSPTNSRWSGYPFQLTYDEQGKAKSALALLHMLVERWMAVVDAYATAEQLRLYIQLLVNIAFEDISPPNKKELRPHDVLAIVLRSAQFWELRNIRSVFLSFLTESTLVLDDSPSEKQVTEIAFVYKLVLYFPMEYFSKPSRTDLVRRALRADILLSSGAESANANNFQFLTALRVFLKRIFVYTGHVEPSTLGHAGFLEHLMSSKLADAADQITFIDTTLELIRLYFRELLKFVERDGTDIIVKVLGSLKTWALCEMNVMSTRGVGGMVDLMVAEFVSDRFPEEVGRSLRTLRADLVALVLPRMTALVDREVTVDILKNQSDSMALWTSLLSFGRWLAQENEVQLFGCSLALKIVAVNNGDRHASLDDARIVTLSMMFQELRCLPEGCQAEQLDQIVAVYVSFSPILDSKGQERLDGYMSRACRNISVSNYAHMLDLVSEVLSNHRACSPGGLMQIVYLATRLLKDYPQNTFKYLQVFATRCINTFAGRVFVDGSPELHIRVLDYIVQLSSERPAALRSSDLSGIWRLMSEYLAPSHLHDQETSTALFHRIISVLGALVRLRRDLIAWTLPHLGMVLRQLILCMRACRPMLGAKQTAMVMDTQPRWVNAKQALGVNEAKALSRLLQTLDTKTVIRTHVQPETQKAESLAKPFSKHAIYVVTAYIECMNDPLCVLSVDVRRELQPGLFALCGMVSEYGRDAVMVSALDAGGKTLMKALWREYEKQRYVGKG
ncbi:hypothetical protein AX15_005748 [Amanita polypyramis BW_CC]|nr:hypothetical protein AX15_005748 [Amanita polypyramis BW_CC]